MIPLHLQLAGFLSYRDAIELDFTPFSIACISGYNGAGKSSLLDAITWALFGQARKRDESLINLQSKAAEVAFTFQYEQNIYRVLRSWPRGKSTLLEFQVLDGRLESPNQLDGNWRPLTERSLRETQARIEQTLRLDYETFINASFFLQGKADQFTQQNPAKRKEVLSSVLGLEHWEIYKERTAARRRALEEEVHRIEGQLEEIEAELAEEQPRRQRLKDLEAERERLRKSRQAQESTVESIRKNVSLIERQRALVENLAAVLARARADLSELQGRLAEREAALALQTELLAHAAEIEAAYREWQSLRAELENWEAIAARFRSSQEKRQPLLRRIEAEKARLEQEQQGLLQEQQKIQQQQASMLVLQAQIAEVQNLLAEAESRLTQRPKLEEHKEATRQQHALLKAENEALRADMEQLKTRIEALQAAEGATCPLCGQPLSAKHRVSTLKQLQAEGKEKGDRFRSNKARLRELEEAIKTIEEQFGALSALETEQRAYANRLTALNTQLRGLEQATAQWEAVGQKRLKEVERALNDGQYALEAQKKLAQVDRELAQLGYDAAVHDAARDRETKLRTAEGRFREVEAARAAVQPIQDEIASLKSNLARRQSEVALQEQEYERVAAELEAARAGIPDLDQAERLLYDLQEQENRLNQEVGGAQQKVAVLNTLRERKAALESRRQTLLLQIARHKTLERAFGKDGVPALLIEQALPQIEAKANELLDRLSEGRMSIRFLTQTSYKDKKRQDLRETLEIQISDMAGVRDYEMYSGGEAFRVNFAIRLALSEVLAQRKGARLQLLVIDEGFGSQDANGRQRLIEAINLVRDDFAKILVITHLDELKDVFPARIEVEKTERGSTFQVIA